MTIDEAIARALEEAGEYQERADGAELIDILDGLDVESCKQCAADHRQLAEWLTELKEWKENPFWQIKTECKKIMTAIIVRFLIIVHLHTAIVLQRNIR